METSDKIALDILKSKCHVFDKDLLFLNAYSQNLFKAIESADYDELCRISIRIESIAKHLTLTASLIRSISHFFKRNERDSNDI